AVRFVGLSMRVKTLSIDDVGRVKTLSIDDVGRMNGRGKELLGALRRDKKPLMFNQDYDIAQHQNQLDLKITMDDDDDSCTLSITVGGGEIFQLCVTGYLREQIKSHFKQNLFGIVTNLQKRGKGKSDALELIKHLCVVFKLDNYLTYEIEVHVLTSRAFIIKGVEWCSGPLRCIYMYKDMMFRLDHHFAHLEDCQDSLFKCIDGSVGYYIVRIVNE
ncbi:hypothetical protein Tco_0994109, partial [Tanacetum coccineum]